MDERATYKIIKPVDENDNLYLAVGESRVLYKNNSYEYIETRGSIQSRGSWLHLKTSKKTFS